jgi:hypothetical protein
MRMRQAPLSFFCAAAFAAVILTGCLGGRLHSEEPPGLRLQGVWKLNRGASQDPQKIIDALRAQADKKIRRAMNAPPVPVSSGGGGGRRRRGGGAGAGSPAEPDEYVAQGPPPGLTPGGDSLRNSPTMHALTEVLQRSDYVTIRQSPDQVSFDYGNYKRSYTPGGHSVVSSENGVADQASGWNGKEYLINIQPQLGPEIVEQYGLSPDGKQLVVKTRIGPFELQKVELTRVYDSTTTVVPNSGPSND